MPFSNARNRRAYMIHKDLTLLIIFLHALHTINMRECVVKFALSLLS